MCTKISGLYCSRKFWFLCFEMQIWAHVPLPCLLFCKKDGSCRKAMEHSPDLREDHLPVHTLKWWRSNVWRMIVESICWHNCSWTMVYPLRIYMSVRAAPVSHTFALYFCLVFNICFVSLIWYTFAMSVLLGLYCLHGKARLFRSWFLYGALSTPMASYVF